MVDKDSFIYKELMGLNKSENPKVKLTKNVWQKLPIASQYLLPASPLINWFLGNALSWKATCSNFLQIQPRYWVIAEMEAKCQRELLWRF